MNVFFFSLLTQEIMLFNSEVNLAFLSLQQRLLNDLQYDGGPGFLAVVRYGSSPTPLPLSRQRREILVLQKSFNTLWSPHLLLFGPTTESVFVNLLRAQESTPGPGGAGTTTLCVVPARQFK